MTALPKGEDIATRAPRNESSVVREYLEFINGLRCIAVLFVVAFHIDLQFLSGGFVGVDVFFVISGFLITGICVSDGFSLGKFYRSRVLRICPAYFVTLLATAIVGCALLLPENVIALAWTELYSVLFLQNFYFWHTINYFDTGQDNILLHTWSLAVEWQFYLLLPLLVLLLRRSRPLLIVALALVALASFAASVAATSYRPQAAFYLVPFRMWEFLAGGFLAFLRPRQLPRLTADALSLAGLVLIVVPALVFTSVTPFPGLNALYPCLGAALMIHGCRASKDSLFNKALSNTVFSLIGKASYSIYLVHWPLIILAKYLYVTELPIGARLLLGVLSILLGFVSWRYVEQPFRIGRPGKGRRPLPQVFAPVLPVIALGLVGLLTHGLPARFSAQTLSLAAAAQEQGEFRRCLEPWAGAQEEFCRLGAVGKPGVDFIVWGDSYADALLDGIVDAANRSGDSGIFVGTHACPPLVGYPGTSGPSKRRCDELHRRIAQIVADRHPSEIILHGAWLPYDKLDDALFKRSTSPPPSASGTDEPPSGVFPLTSVANLTS